MPSSRGVVGYQFRVQFTGSSGRTRRLVSTCNSALSLLWGVFVSSPWINLFVCYLFQLECQQLEIKSSTQLYRRYVNVTATNPTDWDLQFFSTYVTAAHFQCRITVCFFSYPDWREELVHQRVGECSGEEWVSVTCGWQHCLHTVVEPFKMLLHFNCLPQISTV